MRTVLLRRSLSILFLIGALSSQQLMAQTLFFTVPAEEQSSRVDHAIQSLQDAGFQGAIAIKIGGQAPRFAGFGRIKDRDFPPENLQVDLLSITKTVTASAVLKLVEQNQLSLEETLTEFFTDVPDDKATITVHQLLTHSAGFRDSLGSDNRIISRDDYIAKAMNSRLRFEPGSSYSYSNVGFSLLAAIIELQSGKSYEAFIRDQLLPKDESLRLGYHSVFDPDRSLLTGRGKDITAASWGQNQAYWHLIGNGGMVADVGSALRFFDLLTSSILLTQTSTTQLFTPHQQELPADSFYGYGVVIDEGPLAKRFHWHNGGNNNFTSWWSYHLDHKVLLFAAGTGRFTADDAASMLIRELFQQ